MPKIVRNKFYENLIYEKLLEAHIKSRKGKGYRKEIIYSNVEKGFTNRKLYWLQICISKNS